MPSHRNCCVVGCTNSYYTIIQWQKQLCDIHNDYRGGGKCVCEDPFRWIKFPGDSDSKCKWLKLINRQNFVVREHTRICSEHFKFGKPTDEYPYPTEKMGYSLDKTPKGRKSRAKPTQHEWDTPREPKRTKTCLNQDNSDMVHVCGEHGEHLDKSDSSAENQHDHTVITCATGETGENNITEHSYAFSNSTVKFDEFEHVEEDMSSCEGCFYRQKELVKVKEELKQEKNLTAYWKSKYYEKNNKPFGFTNIENDKMCRSFTGIPTTAAFEAIYNTLAPQVSRMRHWRGARTVCNIVRKYTAGYPRRKHGFQSYLSAKDEMLLTLMKIRLNLPHTILALLFGVVDTTVSRIWMTWVTFLSRELVTLNPVKEFVRSSLPESFRNSKYSNVRHIIDCSEVFIETPKNFVTRSLTWSEYKHHNTAKFLVSINPNGYICYISPCWGGRSSDSHITKHSGFEQYFEPYDSVMADKGFSNLASWFAQHLCTLIVPPGKCGESQFGKADVLKTKDVANRRIYVEQAIRRLKTFKMLRDEMTISNLPHIDKILRIGQFLSNLLVPIAKRK